MGMTHREEIDKEASVVDDRRAHTSLLVSRSKHGPFPPVYSVGVEFRRTCCIQKNADQYVGPSDLLQNWKNGVEYIFMESKDDVDELASVMKTNEMDGAKSVHLVFPSSPRESLQTSNYIAINVSGFSNGFDAFQNACASPQ
jgi:hypothetical protein